MNQSLLSAEKTRALFFFWGYCNHPKRCRIWPSFLFSGSFWVFPPQQKSCLHVLSTFEPLNKTAIPADYISWLHRFPLWMLIPNHQWLYVPPAGTKGKAQFQCKSAEGFADAQRRWLFFCFFWVLGGSSQVVSRAIVITYNPPIYTVYIYMYTYMEDHST